MSTSSKYGAEAFKRSSTSAQDALSYKWKQLERGIAPAMAT